MFNINTYVIYKRDVCKVIGIEQNKYTNQKCYILSPTFDSSLKISVPIDNKNGYLRKLMTKEEINELIREIPNVEIIKTDSHTLENEYRNLLHSGKLKDLITIIKTTYLRNKERQDSKRSIGQKDKEYFDKAERYLYNEIAIVLGKTYEEAKQFVITKVKENEK